MHMYVLTAQAKAEEIVTHGQGLAPQGVNIMLVVHSLGQGWGGYPKERYPRGNALAGYAAPDHNAHLRSSIAFG